jgi:hypothetical protein
MSDWHWPRQSASLPPEASSPLNPPLTPASTRRWHGRHLQKGERSALIGRAITPVVLLIGGALALISAATRPASRATPPISANAGSATSTAPASIPPTAQFVATASPRPTSTLSTAATVTRAGPTKSGLTPNGLRCILQREAPGRPRAHNELSAIKCRCSIRGCFGMRKNGITPYAAHLRSTYPGSLSHTDSA